MANKGGARPEAGRPTGSTPQPQLRDFYSDELKDLVESLNKRALTDNVLAKKVAKQLFNKATQPLTGPDGRPIQIEGAEITVHVSSVWMTPRRVLKSPVTID